MLERLLKGKLVLGDAIPELHDLSSVCQQLLVVIGSGLRQTVDQLEYLALLEFFPTSKVPATVRRRRHGVRLGGHLHGDQKVTSRWQNSHRTAKRISGYYFVIRDMGGW